MKLNYIMLFVLMIVLISIVSVSANKSTNVVKSIIPFETKKYINNSLLWNLSIVQKEITVSEEEIISTFGYKQSTRQVITIPKNVKGPARFKDYPGKKIFYNFSDGTYYIYGNYTKSEMDSMIQQIINKKANESEYKDRIGVLLNNSNIPLEITITDSNGEVIGIDYNSSIFYLQEEIRELKVQLDSMQVQIDKLKESKP